MATEEARRLVTFDEQALLQVASRLSDAERRLAVDTMKKCDKAFRYDQMFAVHSALSDWLLHLDSLASSSAGDDADGGPAAAAVSAFVRGTPMFTVSEKKTQMGRQVLDRCLRRDQWTPVSVDEQGFGTYYKAEPGCTYHSFLTRGVVEAPLVALSGVLLELDMYKLWYPRAVVSEELLVVSTFHRQSRLVLSVPVIANREVAVDGYGIDDLKNGRVVIVARGLEDNDTLADGSPVPPVLDGHVRCGMSEGGYLLEIGTRESTTVSFMMNVDPRIPLIPGWLIEYVSRNLMGEILRNIGTAAKAGLSPDSPYSERRKVRSDVYDHIQRMVDTVFPPSSAPGA